MNDFRLRTAANNRRTTSALRAASLMAAFAWLAAVPCAVRLAAAQEAAATIPALPPSVAEVVAPSSDEPAVRAVLGNNPQTPAELVRAARILGDLGRADLARPMLAKVSAAGLDDAGLVDLYKAFDAALWLNLAARGDLQPEGAKLSDAVLDAMKRQLRDPQQLTQAVAQFQLGTPRQRDAAAATLLAAGSAAIEPLMLVLADDARKAEHAAVRTLLVQFEGDAIEPLMAIVRSGDATLGPPAAELLAALHATKATAVLTAAATMPQSPPALRAAAALAVKQLTGQAPSATTAAPQLLALGREAFASRRPLEGAVLGQFETWIWDPQTRRFTRASLDAAAARRRQAAEWAADAYALAPKDPSVRLLYLTTLFDEAAYRNGLDRPLPADDAAAKVAADVELATLADVLRLALDAEHPGAAAAAAQLLGARGTADALLTAQATPGPLAAALLSPDRRVRLAAAEAIVGLHPRQSFPGASLLPTTLAYFVAVRGQPAALVVAPNTRLAQEIAGLLTGEGFVVEISTTAREAMLAATSSPELTVVYIDTRIPLPGAATLLQQLRHDPRTALTPVAMVAESGSLDKAEHIARNDPLALAFYRPRDAEALRWQLGRLDTLRSPTAVGEEERLAEAKRAMDLIVTLAEIAPASYDLQNVEEALTAALYVPALSEKAAAALAHVPSTEVQRTLVDLASTATQPLELRQAAAQAFCAHRQRHGLLLTTSEIQQQYDRYNQSEQLDRQTQKVLSDILDCIEAGLPAKKTTPAPAAPAPTAAPAEALFQ